MLPTRIIASIFVGLLAVLGSGCADSDPPRDVILITADTLRPDHLSLYGYERRTSPELERWFGDGAVFERAYSTEANTSPSVVSILSGQLPQEHRVRLLFQRLPTEVEILPDLLPSEYQTAAFVSNVVLTEEAMAIAHRFDHYDDFVDTAVGAKSAGVFERQAAGTTTAALRWLREEADPDRPLFLWVHYIDPHGPYEPPEGANRGFADDLRSRREAEIREAVATREQDTGNAVIDKVMMQRASNAENVLDSMDLYDAEIAYMDGSIGRLLDGYAALRPVDEALMLFTADHGESMAEHELWFAHGYHVYEEVIRVPFAVRGPGVAKGRRSGLVSGIDVVPTILAFAGGASAAKLNGFDVRSSSIPDDRTVFSEATQYGHWRSAVQGNTKWVVGLERGESTVVEERRYDLVEDARELSPKTRFEDAPTIVRLRQMIASDPDPGGFPTDMDKGKRLRAPKVDPRVDAEQLEKLRALGYVHD